MANLYKINNVEYECEFTLTNADGQKIEFTKSPIRGMSIISNIFEPFESGTISIANPYDFIERTFLLRGDGRDEFKIKIKAKDQNDDKKYEHVFVVVSEDNAGNPETRSENIKTYTLVDKNKLPFMEQIPYGTIFKGKVGDIIKAMFEKLLGSSYVGDVWEAGDFEIEYIPNVYDRYIDVLNEMLHYFYAKDGDIHVKAFLNYDRIRKRFEFPLISKLFKDNKKLVTEAFSVGDLTTKFEPSENDNNPPPDAETGQYIAGFRNVSYSTPAHDITNDFFVNRLVYSEDRILGNMLIKKIDIREVKEKWSEKFVKVFSSVGGEPKPFLVLNKSADKKFKHHKLPYSLKDNVGIVESELNMNLIFYNLQLYFNNIGDTYRHSGKFIDVYKSKKQKLKSDEKLLGRWFVTEVRHVFFGDTYMNEFYCTKTYIGSTGNVNDNVE